MSRMVRLTVLRDERAAEILRALLRTEGIRSSVRVSNTGVAPGMWHVYVDEADLEQAERFVSYVPMFGDFRASGRALASSPSFAFKDLRLGLAAFLGGLTVIAVSAFADTCQNTGMGHDRAIVTATASMGGFAFVLLLGHTGRRLWVAAALALAVAIATTLLLSSAQYGACVA